MRSVLSDSLPGLRLLRQYQLGWLRGDVVAGVVLAAYLLPAGIGDASLAGLPPEAGLYSCLFAGLVFWLFCSSRHTAVTVTSAISLVVGTSLGDLAGGDATRYAALASATALIVAVLAFAAWALRRGKPRELHLRDGHDRLQDRGRPAPGQHAAPEAVRVQGRPRRLLGADGALLLAPLRDEPRFPRPRRGRARPCSSSARSCSRTVRWRSWWWWPASPRFRCSGWPRAGWPSWAPSPRACRCPACRPFISPT